MLQYLLNATAIWLISLFLFDVLLRKESYHVYNRAYLLITFLAGILMPLLPRSANATFSHIAAASIPIQKISAAKETIATIATPPATSTINFTLVLLFLYVAGAAIALAFLLIEIFKLIRYYNTGNRYKEGKAMIIETGADHTPFSIFNKVFVSKRSDYSDQEWQIVLDHEVRHYSLWHIVDVLIMQVSRMLFWFHPLVYTYNKRLLMIHEYQADKIGSSRLKMYSTFLLEQSLLHSAPSISHSFNHSPIKKRIVMLTSKSSRQSQMKLLLAIPLLIFCLLCFSKSSYSFKGGKNTIIFKGNEFEFGFPKSDKGKSPAVVDGRPASRTKTLVRTGSSQPSIKFDTMNVKPMGVAPISVELFSAPLKMNGKKITSEDEVTTPAVFQGKDNDLGAYLIDGLSQYLPQLPNGRYEISIGYPIIDEDGKLVYYENRGVIPNDDKIKIDQDLREKIKTRINELLDNAPDYKPATLNGKPVLVYKAWGVALGTHIILKDHVVEVEKRKPRQLK